MLKRNFERLQQISEEQNPVGPNMSNSILKKMMAQAMKNQQKAPQGHRFTDPVLDHFCMNVWILGGRQLYEILKANFHGVFPSPSAIERKLNEYHVDVPEGVINVTALKEYLTSNGLPPFVCISEDGTAVKGRREYNSKTNRILGFSLPLQSNGLPDYRDSIVETAEDIVHHFDSFERATVAMIIMAQPIVDGFPPLRLCAFSSNNKSSACDVESRLDFIKSSLNAVGICVIAYSADGDSREMKVMRSKLNLGSNLKRGFPSTPSLSFNWFFFKFS